jgi:murein DD-endopeptidase MepM/ murein hydrolase activator NlpD
LRSLLSVTFLVFFLLVFADSGYSQQDVIVYHIQPGDTLSEIAYKFNLAPEVLATMNGLTNADRIRAGDKLVISYQPLTHVVKKGETLSVIGKRYGVTVQALSDFNHLRNPDLIQVGQRLLIPPVGGEEVSFALLTSGEWHNARFVWPLDGGLITSLFGPRGNKLHKGMDIAAPKGTSVRAAADGRVTYADWAGTYGILVVIDHGNGLITRYAHNSALKVKAGDLVKAGDEIASVGSTGNSTGPHLHFEVEINQKVIDPLLVLYLNDI